MACGDEKLPFWHQQKRFSEKYVFLLQGAFFFEGVCSFLDIILAGLALQC